MTKRIRADTVYGDDDLRKIIEEEREHVLKQFEAKKKGDSRLCYQMESRILDLMEREMNTRVLENERKQNQNEIMKREAMDVVDDRRNDM